MSMKQYVILAIAFLIVAGVAGGYAGALVAGILEPHLRYEQLTLVDEHGVVRARAGATDEGGYGLTLLDEDGNRRAEFSLTAGDTPQLVLVDDNDRVRARVAAELTGEGGLRLYNAEGVQQASFGVDADSAAEALLNATDGNRRVRLSTELDGGPGVDLLDDAGQSRGRFSLTDQGRPALALGGGGARLLAGTSDGERPFLRLSDAEGALRAELAEDEDGSVGLELRDAGSDPMLSMLVPGQGGGAYNVHDATGRVAAAVERDEGQPRIWLQPEEDSPRIGLLTGTRNLPEFTLEYDEVTRVFVGFTEDMNARLAVQDGDGETEWEAP